MSASVSIALNSPPSRAAIVLNDCASWPNSSLPSTSTRAEKSFSPTRRAPSRSVSSGRSARQICGDAEAPATISSGDAGHRRRASTRAPRWARARPDSRWVATTDQLRPANSGSSMSGWSARDIGDLVVFERVAARLRAAQRDAAATRPARPRPGTTRSSPFASPTQIPVLAGESDGRRQRYAGSISATSRSLPASVDARVRGDEECAACSRDGRRSRRPFPARQPIRLRGIECRQAFDLPEERRDAS